MRRFLITVLLTTMAAADSPGSAALKVGEKAPDFSAQASLGGKQFNFSLAEALKQGPVVLYFYPAAFTKGCTVEAHDFAEAMPAYKSIGACVIGVSHDDIALLDKFSTSECRSKFAVAADPEMKVITAYDARISLLLPYSSRTSYVIAPDRTILLAYTDLNPDQHVAKTMAAVKAWHEKHK